MLLLVCSRQFVHMYKSIFTMFLAIQSCEGREPVSLEPSPISPSLHFDSSNDVPDFLSGVAKLAASNASTQSKVANTNAVVFEIVGEIILALCHSSHENTAAFIASKTTYVVIDTDNGGICRECDLAAVGRKVFGDWSWNHFEKFLWRRGGTDREAMKELNHES